MAETRKKDNILLGAGELYIQAFTGSEIPTDAIIEVEANNVGHCSGGFSVEYKPEQYEVLNQYEKVVKRFITKEEVTCKTGILTWNLDNISLLSNADLTTTETKKTITIGAKGELQTLLVRFVHTKEDGKKLRFTMCGNAGDGFSLEFANKEVVVDSTIKAIEVVNGVLALFEEEI